MNDDDFFLLLDSAGERVEVEYKSSLSLTAKPDAATVARAVLGMSNRPGGGIVVIGVKAPVRNHPDQTYQALGVDTTELATWTQDNLDDQMAKYADPGVRVELIRHERNGAAFLEISVQEFQSSPVFAKRGYGDKVRKGALYVRDPFKAETVEVSTSEQMNLLINLGVQKGLRRFIETAQRAGIHVSSTVSGSASSATTARAEAGVLGIDV